MLAIVKGEQTKTILQIGLRDGRGLPRRPLAEITKVDLNEETTLDHHTTGCRKSILGIVSKVDREEVVIENTVINFNSRDLGDG